MEEKQENQIIINEIKDIEGFSDIEGITRYLIFIFPFLPPEMPAMISEMSIAKMTEKDMFNYFKKVREKKKDEINAITYANLCYIYTKVKNQQFKKVLEYFLLDFKFYIMKLLEGLLIILYSILYEKEEKKEDAT